MRATKAICIRAYRLIVATCFARCGLGKKETIRSRMGSTAVSAAPGSNVRITGDVWMSHISPSYRGRPGFLVGAHRQEFFASADQAAGTLRSISTGNFGGAVALLALADDPTQGFRLTDCGFCCYFSQLEGPEHQWRERTHTGMVLGDSLQLRWEREGVPMDMNPYEESVRGAEKSKRMEFEHARFR